MYTTTKTGIPSGKLSTGIRVKYGTPGMSDVFPLFLGSCIRAIIWFHFSTCSFLIPSGPFIPSVVCFFCCWSSFLATFQTCIHLSCSKQIVFFWPFFEGGGWRWGGGRVVSFVFVVVVVIAVVLCLAGRMFCCWWWW